jgi:hypothetical protein
MTNWPEIIQRLSTLSENGAWIIDLGATAKRLNEESRFDEHPRDRGQPITAPRTDR